VIKLIVMWRKK